MLIARFLHHFFLERIFQPPATFLTDRPFAHRKAQRLILKILPTSERLPHPIISTPIFYSPLSACYRFRAANAVVSDCRSETFSELISKGFSLPCLTLILTLACPIRDIDNRNYGDGKPNIPGKLAEQ